MGKKITILTSSSETPDISSGDVGVLVECASDSKFAIKYGDFIHIHSLIGNLENTRRLACDLATKIVSGEPFLRGVPQLNVFHEVLSAKFHGILHVIQLHDFLLAEGYSECEFHSASWWGDSLRNLIHIIGSTIMIITPNSLHQTKLSKCFNRISSGKFSWDILYSELKRVIDYIDPFHRRSIFLKKFKKIKIEKKKPWFYSTAVSFSNIGLLYESFFPEPFIFLAENSLTGGKPLKEKKRNYVNLYDYAAPEFIPNHNELRRSIDIIHQHISSIALDSHESVARSMFLSSSWLAIFYLRLLPNGLFASSIFENWINFTEPSAVMVGNQVFEGYCLYKARDKKIPTILFQHGVLADYYPYSDHPVDSYVVRGHFFYERLSAVSQKRAVILNPPAHDVDNSKDVSVQYIIFVTTPFEARALTLDVDLESILRTLILTISSTRMELVIRVHPLERIIDYKLKVEALLKECGAKVIISYSQGGGLNELIANAVAVVLFGSTVFLDCIKYQVPVISVDWYDFACNPKIKQHEIFHVAENLADFSRLISVACGGQLKSNFDSAKMFLAETSEEDFTSTIQKIM